MRRAFPFLLFASLAVAVFWRFLLFNESLYAVKTVRSQFGETELSGRDREDYPDPSPDNILLLPLNLRIYNAGLKAGELRLWNPNLFCGYPIYADPMVQPFYPPHLVLHFLLGPDAALEVSLMLHFFFSGVAMFFLIRVLGRGEAAGAVGGVVWMLFGYNAVYFSSSVLLGAGVFGPLALAAIVRGLERKDWTFALWAGLAMGMVILGSHPQYALHLFLVFVAWLAARASRERGGRAFVLRFGAIFASVAIGVGLAAILSRLETVATGYRQPSYDMRQYYAEPWTLAVHLLDLLVGKGWFRADPLITLQFPAYAGLAATGLAAVGAWRGRREMSVRFFAIVGAVALAVAFLKPLALLAQEVPLLNLSPSARWIFTFGFCLPILAARGLEALARDPGRAAWIAGGIVAAFLLVCLAHVGPFRWTSPRSMEILLGFAILLGAAGAIRRFPRSAYGLCLLGLLVELFPHFLAYNSHRDASVLRKVPEPVRFVMDREGEHPWRGTGGLGSAYARLGRLSGAEISFGNNILATYGVENPAGYEAIIPIQYVAFCGKAQEPIDPAGRAVLFTEFGSPLLQLTGLRYIFWPFAHSDPPPPYRLLHQWGSLRLYENPEALARARLVSRVIGASGDDDAFRLLGSPRFDLRRSVILENVGSSLSPGAASAGEVRWTERSSDRLRLEVRAESEGILVLADTDYPGWEATVDGKPTSLYRANLAFRAIAVPAGIHEVQFRFRPILPRVGLVGSALSAALALGWLLRRRLARCAPAAIP